jgi:hypothetical protein
MSCIFTLDVVHASEFIPGSVTFVGNIGTDYMGAGLLLEKAETLGSDALR